MNDIKKENTNRILWVLNGFTSNGISIFVLNYLSHLDLTKNNYYLCISGNYIDNSLYQELIKLDIKIYILPCRKRETLKYFFAIQRLIKENKINIAHFHGNSSTLVIDLLAAKIAGCSIRIAHCHNSDCEYKKANVILRPLLNILYTVGFACSDKAAINMFGVDYEKHKVRIIRNGIDVRKFIFDSNKRIKVRKELGIDDSTIVLGHIGMFNNQKNQKFLLELMKNLKGDRVKYQLVLVGIGEHFEAIKNQIQMENIQNVTVLGKRDDVDCLMSAFDIFLFPSIFEGFGIVSIEAQSSGLPCIVFEAVPRIVDVNSISFLPLVNDVWLYMIKKTELNCNEKRIRLNQRMILNNWDIRSCCLELENIYESLLTSGREYL